MGSRNGTPVAISARPVPSRASAILICVSRVLRSSAAQGLVSPAGAKCAASEGPLSIVSGMSGVVFFIFDLSPIAPAPAPGSGLRDAPFDGAGMAFEAFHPRQPGDHRPQARDGGRRG